MIDNPVCPNCKSLLTEKETSIEATTNGMEVSMKGIPLYYCEACQSFHLYATDIQPAISLLRPNQPLPVNTANYLYTLEEVANMLRVTKQTVYNMLWKGRIKGQKSGREWRIPATELERLQNE